MYMSNGGPRLRVAFEPVDYKGQEPSNLVFSEFRRALLCSKTFFSVTEPSGALLFCFSRRKNKRTRSSWFSLKDRRIKLRVSEVQ